MKSTQLKLRRIKMNAIKTINNLISVRLVSNLIISLCVGILLSCSGGDVSGPEINFSGGGFKDNDPEFTADKTIVDEIPVENHNRIIVEAINGEVVITGQSDAQNVTITAHLYVSSDSQEDADLHLDDLDILVTDSINEILIQTVQPQNINGRTYLVEYDIIVPNSFEVETSQANGTIAILDIQNSVEVSNKNGDVLLSGIVGGIIADVENGSIDGTVVLPLNETIDLSVNNGGLELSIPTSTSAEFSATVHGTGEIIVSDLDLTDPLSTSKSLTGTLGDGESSIVLSTVNGNIEVIGFD
jgi:osmotically-inducible protein OsmY